MRSVRSLPPSLPFFIIRSLARILISPLLPHPASLCLILLQAGAVSIDDKLLLDGPQERASVGIFVMKNGCICCTAGSGALLAPRVPRCRRRCHLTIYLLVLLYAPLLFQVPHLPPPRLRDCRRHRPPICSGSEGRAERNECMEG